MEYTIFSDGASRGNPGPGGWGAVIVQSAKGKVQNLDAEVIELGGSEKVTTNNRMELRAVIEGLKKIPHPSGTPFKKGELKLVNEGHTDTLELESAITLFSDSSYVINGATKWLKGWKRNNWQTKAKKDVLNKDLWLELDEVIKNLDIKWEYVGGHVGIKGNERCDEIATAFADGESIELYKGSLANYHIPDILDISLDAGKQAAKESASSHSKAKAYSYVSSINGVIQVHHSWPECEKRVKGVRGAKFKKAVSKEDEERIVAKFGSL